MGAVPLIAMGASAILSAGGAVMGAISQGNQASYAAAVAQQNSDAARQQAAYVRGQGARQEQEEIWKARAFLGEQEAAQASSGLDISSGSPSEVREGTKLLARTGFRNIRDQTARTALGYDQEAINQQAEAKMQKAAAGNTTMNAIIGATGSLLGSASGIGGKYMDMKRTGVPMWEMPSSVSIS
jgi:hypothetical protein